MNWNDNNNGPWGSGNGGNPWGRGPSDGDIEDKLISRVVFQSFSE